MDENKNIRTIITEVEGDEFGRKKWKVTKEKIENEEEDDDD